MPSAAAKAEAAPAKAEAPKAEAPKKEAAPAPKAKNEARGRSQCAAPAARSCVRSAARKRAARTFASPLARRIAKDAGVDVSAVSGIRPAWPRRQGGRRGGDRRRRRQGAPAAKPAPGAAPAAAPAVKPMSDEAVLKLFEQGSYELVPHDNMRKTIARRLVEAKTTIPHFYLTLDCEIDALLALRAADQCGGADEEDRQGRGAGLQAFGQRHGHQGDGAGACATCRTPTPRGPTPPWSSTSMPMSASPCRSPAG